MGHIIEWLRGTANYIAKLHLHKWRGMGWSEWRRGGGQGTPDWVCYKCGERRFWSET